MNKEWGFRILEAIILLNSLFLVLLVEVIGWEAHVTVVEKKKEEQVKV